LPQIQQETRRQMQLATSSYILWVVPLLVENRLSAKADRVLVVDVPKETQIARTMLRDRVSRQHAEHIIAAQATREQRLAVADDVIENMGSPDAIASAVARLHAKYQQLAAQAASQEKP
jgi:dephospho-CoA kinase